MDDGWLKDFARMSKGFVEDPHGDLLLLDQSKTGIEQGDGENFTVGEAELLREKVVDTVGAVDWHCGRLGPDLRAGRGGKRP